MRSENGRSIPVASPTRDLAVTQGKDVSDWCIDPRSRAARRCRVASFGYDHLTRGNVPVNGNTSARGAFSNGVKEIDNPASKGSEIWNSGGPVIHPFRIRSQVREQHLNVAAIEGGIRILNYGNIRFAHVGYPPGAIIWPNERQWICSDCMQRLNGVGSCVFLGER
jgi:hypothetical protein